MNCQHPKEDRYFSDDMLWEWCGMCGQVVTDHHERKYGEPHPDFTARSAAAAAMGSARSERKAAAVRENGRKGGRPRLTPEERARRRVARSPRLSKYEAVIFYDWPEGESHLRWIATAKVSEIVDWAEAVG